MAKHLTAAALITAMSLSVTAQATTYQKSTNHHSALFETKVIEDRGGIPIDLYIPKDNAEQHQREVFERRANTRLFDSHFPVVSKTLSVGRVGQDEAKDIPFHIASKPMFIVGYDPVSIQWLQANKALLNEKGAIGLVVNVASNAQMIELQNIVGEGVMMQPTPGDNIAEHLRIKHYPFYLDNEGVMR